jgi:hypothetical protein
MERGMIKKLFTFFIPEVDVAEGSKTGLFKAKALVVGCFMAFSVQLTIAIVGCLHGQPIQPYVGFVMSPVYLMSLFILYRYRS